MKLAMMAMMHRMMSTSFALLTDSACRSITPRCGFASISS